MDVKDKPAIPSSGMVECPPWSFYSIEPPPFPLVFYFFKTTLVITVYYLSP